MNVLHVPTITKNLVSVGHSDEFFQTLSTEAGKGPMEMREHEQQHKAKYVKILEDDLSHAHVS